MRKIDHSAIVARGLELTKSVPLPDLSIVRIAAEFDVTPASVHYHVHGREALTADILILFVANLLKIWPAPEGTWQQALESATRTIYRHFRQYPGIAAYFALQNRFSALVPALDRDPQGHLLDFLDRYFGLVRGAGLDERQTATYATLLLQFTHVAAHRSASHQWPAEQRQLGAHFASLDGERFPNLAAVRDSYLKLGGEGGFEAGLELFLSGLELQRRQAKRSRPGLP